MRSAKTDKHVCFIMLVIFFYTFYIMGGSYVYCEDLPYWGYNCREDEVVGLEWSLAVYLSPVVFLVFFFFIVFKVELEPVNRRWVKYHIKKGFRLVRWKLKYGIKEYRDWIK